MYFGNANGAGEENRNVGRMAALLAGLPTSVPGVTVNRLCASGLEAVIQAARAIALGDASIALAGGVESMTRAPYVLPKSDKPFPAGHTELYSTTLGWRMVNPRMEPRWTVPLGRVGGTHRRQAQDQPRAAGRVRPRRSHHKAARAQRQGLFDAELDARGDPASARATRSSSPPTSASGRTPPWRRWPSSSRPSARRAAR